MSEPRGTKRSEEALHSSQPSPTSEYRRGRYRLPDSYYYHRSGSDQYQPKRPRYEDFEYKNAERFLNYSETDAERDTWTRRSTAPRRSDLEHGGNQVENENRGPAHRDWARGKLKPKEYKNPLTCFYWQRGGCAKTASQCAYAHCDTGYYSSPPNKHLSSSPLDGGNTRYSAKRGITGEHLEAATPADLHRYAIRPAGLRAGVKEENEKVSGGSSSAHAFDPPLERLPAPMLGPAAPAPAPAATTTPAPTSSTAQDPSSPSLFARESALAASTADLELSRAVIAREIFEFTKALRVLKGALADAQAMTAELGGEEGRFVHRAAGAARGTVEDIEAFVREKLGHLSVFWENEDLEE